MTWLLILQHVVIPGVAGLVFFGLAAYLRHIAPMRELITGRLTYQGAFWGFICFGVYLASRPVQLFLGPHPAPLLVNDVREFFMIGLFAPAGFIAMMSLVFGQERVPRWAVGGVFALGIALAIMFAGVNVRAVGGSEALFRWGGVTAHDGLWFKSLDPGSRKYLPILFIIRVLDPCLLLLAAGVVVLWRGVTYPPDSPYTNMPLKLFLLAMAVFAFSGSMLLAGLAIAAFHVPNPWWLYYVGALASGLLELFSLVLPLRKPGQLISRH